MKILTERQILVLARCSLLQIRMHPLVESGFFRELSLLVTFTGAYCFAKGLEEKDYMPTKEEIEWYLEVKKGFFDPRSLDLLNAMQRYENEFGPLPEKENEVK